MNEHSSGSKSIVNWQEDWQGGGCPQVLTKNCSKCRRLLPRDAFDTVKDSSTGLRSQCKEYRRASNSSWMRSAGYHKRNDVMAKDRERSKRRQADEKTKVRGIMNRAIRAGDLVRPPVCSCCNLATDRIQGHHCDYSKPLDVIWLCAGCHGTVHRGSV